jgi:hypothetical protein
LWHSCPSPVVVDPAPGVQTVVDVAAVLFLLLCVLGAVVLGAWVSSMTD